MECKNEFVNDYSALIEDMGSISREKVLLRLDRKIGSLILEIMDEADSAYYNSSSHIIASDMFLLANSLTERHFSSKRFEPDDEMIELLGNELIRNVRTLKGKTRVVLTTGDVKRITIYKGDVAILGVRVFEDDRFDSEAMISCKKSKDIDTTMFRNVKVVSANYIFGTDGVFINASDKSFLDTFGNTGNDDFGINPDLKYYYMKYVDGNLRKTYIDRKNGRRIFYEGERKFESSFAPSILDALIVGGNNTGVYNTLYKQYVKGIDGGSYVVR